MFLHAENRLDKFAGHIYLVSMPVTYEQQIIKVASMEFGNFPIVQELRERVDAFMQEHVFPAEAIFHKQVSEGDRWQPTAIVEELKVKARAAGLWNLFLPESKLGAGLTNLEYAPLAELMGRSGLAS